MNRAVPTSRSSTATPDETVDWTARSRSAARVKLSSSATATKYSRCLVSMDSSFTGFIDECD